MEFRSYSARPERLRDLVVGTPGRPIIVDEVQRVPELLQVVHALLESDPNRLFVLTSSSSRKLRKSGVDLLAGRALHRTLHPFMASELGDAFHFEGALEHGLVPLVVDSPTPREVLRTYVALYMDEEVRLEGWVKDIGGFSRFLEAMTFSHGSVLNLAQVARDCQVKRATVVGYLDVLRDLLLCFELPVFTRRAKRALTTHSKFYYFDAGVFRALRPTGPLDRGSEIDGAALEGLVVQHVWAWNAYRGERNHLYYWRTRAGSEVDVVLYGEDGLHALEVKNTRVIHPRDLNGLRAFGEEYPEATRQILYRGTDRLLVDGIACVPCESFLRVLHPEQTIPV